MDVLYNIIKYVILSFGQEYREITVYIIWIKTAKIKLYLQLIKIEKCRINLYNINNKYISLIF